MHLPSAGMIRFRFDGFTPRRRISVRSAGHPEVRSVLRDCAAAASGCHSTKSAAATAARPASRMRPSAVPLPSASMLTVTAPPAAA